MGVRKAGPVGLVSYPGSDKGIVMEARKSRKFAFFVALTLPVVAALAQDWQITRHTVDGGGTTTSTGGGFELAGTIGQPDAGVLTGGNITLFGGFWFPLVPANCNEDGGVDLNDYGLAEVCLEGPNRPTGAPPCPCFDLDADRDVDLEDMAAFQQAFGY
jgi:hypothetical protein